MMAVMAMFIAATALLTSCQPQDIGQTSRIQLPSNGWTSTLPLTFTPTYNDSAAYYDVKLAVRHHNGYIYSNLALVVDLIATDHTVKRREVNMTLADDYGNWTGGGFGPVYQQSEILAQNIKPENIHTVVVWQAMQGVDTLKALTDMIVTVIPH